MAHADERARAMPSSDTPKKQKSFASFLQKRSPSLACFSCRHGKAAEYETPACSQDGVSSVPRWRRIAKSQRHARGCHCMPCFCITLSECVRPAKPETASLFSGGGAEISASHRHRPLAFHIQHCRHLPACTWPNIGRGRTDWRHGRKRNAADSVNTFGLCD